MSNTSWISDRFRSEHESRERDMMNKAFELERRRKWLAQAPGFFENVIADISTHIEAINAELPPGTAKHKTASIEVSAATNTVTCRYVGTLLMVQLRHNDETLVATCTNRGDKTFKVILQDDETFVLQGNEPDRNRTPFYVDKGNEAQALVLPFVEEVVRLSPKA